MYTIDLAYVGRGLHEELVAYIADQEDFYAEEGVHVALRDGCAWDDRAAAPRRHHRARPGAAVPAGRRHAVGRAERQHRPPAVLVPRPPRPDLPGRPGRSAPRGARPAHRARLLRPDRAAPGGPRPGPRHPQHRPRARRLRHGPAPPPATAASTPPTWAAPWRRRRWPPSTAGTCRPGSATTSRSPPWAWPSTPPTSARTTPRSKPSYEPTAAPCRCSTNDPDTTVRHMQTFLGRHTTAEIRAHYDDVHRAVLQHRRPGRPRRRRRGDQGGGRRTRRPATVTAAEFYQTAAAAES
jgi:NitT/TauT family transport system substrate-binding protein